MGGVHSCLKYASYERSLVLSCDIPFISVEFINKLAEGSKNYSITIGNNKRSQPEPLAGVYQKRILKTMEQYLQTGDYKMSNLLNLPDVRIIDTCRDGFDPDIIFFNVNSRDDLRKLNKAGELK